MGDKLSIIIPNEMKEEIDKLKEVYKEDQSSLIRRLLWKSIKQEKLELALKDYIEDKISLGKAAELANLSIWEITDELKKKKITFNYKLSEAQLEIEKLLKKHEKE
ncbi:MAG: UPF0175 family protein [Candidatus Lokiarchaeia archaeon]